MKTEQEIQRQKAPEIENKNEQVTLKTPQEIIHIKHKISLRQYKYWVLLLQSLKNQFDLKSQPDEDGFYSILMDEISDSIGYLPVKSELKEDLASLRREPICINAMNKDGQKEYYEAGFISEFKITTKKIRFKFPTFLEKTMRGLDVNKAMFTLLNWNIFNHFTGKYEAILYKLCKDYIGVNRTPYMTIEQFRDYIGIGDAEYLQFRELNKFCIKKSIDSVNKSEISDIIISCEFKKDGRNIIGLYFKVEHKKQTSLPFPVEEEESIFRFAKTPIPQPLQIKYSELRTKEEIVLCIERANEYGEVLEKAGKAVNYGGLYRKAINEGWHEQQAAKNAVKASAKDRLEAKMAEKKEAEKSIITEEKRALHQSEERAKAWAAFETLPREKQKEIEKAFLNQAKTVEASSFTRKGNSIPIFKIFLVAYFAQAFTE